MMIVSEKGLPKPKDSREAIIILEKRSILSSSVSLKIQDLVSFRNLLVHLYGKIDEKQEYHNILENQEDILDFVREVKAFLKER